MEKLRECPFCGNTEYLRVEKVGPIYNVKCGYEHCGLDFDSLSNRQAIYNWNLRTESTPEHETVQAWEERTGETYPDDGMTWVWFQGDDYVSDDWYLSEYCNAKETTDFPSFQILVCDKPKHTPDDSD